MPRLFQVLQEYTEQQKFSLVSVCHSEINDTDVFDNQTGLNSKSAIQMMVLVWNTTRGHNPSFNIIQSEGL